MGPSLVQNIIHIIFSTKHRARLILPPYEDELYSYLGGICKEMECTPIKIALMDLLEKSKSNSSKWMKTKDSSLYNFTGKMGTGHFL